MSKNLQFTEPQGVAHGAKPPAIATVAEQVERDLSAIRKHLRRPLEAEFARVRLTVPQTAAMQVLVRNPGISLKQLSRELSLAHSTVSGIADRLEKHGIVERRADPADARIARLYPAPQVNAFVRNRLPNLGRGPLQAALRRTTPKERAQIAAALDLLRKLLDCV